MLPLCPLQRIKYFLKTTGPCLCVCCHILDWKVPPVFVPDHAVTAAAAAAAAFELRPSHRAAATLDQLHVGFITPLRQHCSAIFFPTMMMTFPSNTITQIRDIFLNSGLLSFLVSVFVACMENERSVTAVAFRAVSW